MHEEPTSPPPPAPVPTPPPPRVPSPPSPETRRDDRENPIAVAGLVVSVLALILSVIVVGFVVGIVSFILSAVGLRRARRGLRGRGLAIGGMLLSVLAIVFSIGGALLIASLIRSNADTIVRDGIETTSTNTEDPPQDDVDGIVCSSSTSGRIARAEVTITNRSQGESYYQVTITWTGSGDDVDEVVTASGVGVGESRRLDAVELSGDADPDTCRVSRIERSRFPLL